MNAFRGRLILTDSIIDDGVVEVVDGIIGYVGPADGWSGAPAEPVGTLAPGFVDIHCHGGGGHTVTSADPAAISAAAEHHLIHGTTTMLASLVSAAPDDIAAGIAAIAGVAAGGSSIVGSHLEGPFLETGHRGAHNPSHLRAPDKALAEAWLADSAGSVRMVTIAPELPQALEVARQFEEAGALVGLGHTGADETTFAAALAALRTPLVTHLFNGMEPMHHRTPGPVGATLEALARGTAYVELIGDGVHLSPDTVRMVFAIDPGRHVVLVSDAMVAAGMADGDYTLGPVDVRVTDGTAWTHTEPASLAGGTAHLSDIVRNCITASGIDPVTVVAAATSTPAGLLGLADRGALLTGLRADLVSLDDDWSVTRVMRGGEWVG